MLCVCFMRTTYIEFELWSGVQEWKLISNKNNPCRDAGPGWPYGHFQPLLSPPLLVHPPCFFNIIVLWYRFLLFAMVNPCFPLFFRCLFYFRWRICWFLVFLGLFQLWFVFHNCRLSRSSLLFKSCSFVFSFPIFSSYLRLYQSLVEAGASSSVVVEILIVSSWSCLFSSRRGFRARGFLWFCLGHSFPCVFFGRLLLLWVMGFDIFGVGVLLPLRGGVEALSFLLLVCCLS